MSTALKTNTKLHHNAYVTKDMEAVRHFYEEIIGFPLIATWAELTAIKERSDETHLSAKRIGSQAPPRFPFTHDHRWWSPGYPSSPCKRSCAPLSVTAF